MVCHDHAASLCVGEGKHADGAEARYQNNVNSSRNDTYVGGWVEIVPIEEGALKLLRKEFANSTARFHMLALRLQCILINARI